MSIVDASDGAIYTAAQNDLQSAREMEESRSNAGLDASDDMHPSPAPESVPMTASASNASDVAAQENGDAAASYGTRSRHRTGARPNYAEDKEIDMEIEASGRYPKASFKKAINAARVNEQAESDDPASFRGGGGFAAINANAAASNSSVSAAKDAIPGTSTFSATTPASAPAPAPSKKRKQPGSNTTVSVSISSVAPSKSRQGANSSRLHLETNMMTFERSGARLNSKEQLVADDGTALATNDHAYFVCEPPGEPYYLARIMEFLYADNEPNGRIDAIRVNWYYRPKDIQRRVQDTRVVFSSMHSDTCPLTSLRGRCTIAHLTEIPNLDDYRVQKDSFWFDKLYDRYMHRYYEVIPTSKVINVPQHVKKVLDDRWKFVLVEIGRGRELTSAVKTCKKCSQYAANHDSVDCAVCKFTYHMACIRPPLLKKPARGFAWACAACSRAQELRLEARNTPTLTDSGTIGEDENMEEDDDNMAARNQATRDSSMGPEHHPPATAAQIAQANLWPYRYLGVHCRVEDALDYDDRIYPRASSRLGPRHQANVNVWHGRPVELVKAAEIKKKYLKNTNHKKDGKLSKETLAAIEAEKDSKSRRPKWVVDEPIGYVARGEDTPVDIKGKKEYSAQLTFKMPEASQTSDRGTDDLDVAAPEEREKLVDDFMRKAKTIAPQYGLQEFSVDFLTKAVEKFQENNYDSEKALAALKQLSLRADLKQPDLNREEVKRFEEGVSKYGSELHNVARHVGANFKESRIVRYYYMWKKTERGRQVWGNYEGRRSKKESKRIQADGTSTKLLDDVADDHDDSAFDSGKATEKKRGFECKFCATRKSRQWRRAPSTAPGTLVPPDASTKNSKDKNGWFTLALCGRCAYLWRRYAVQYESIEEVAKKIAAAGGRASKRKIDEELMKIIVEAQNESGDVISASTAAVAASAGVPVPANIIETLEPPKKKPKPDQPVNGEAEAVPEKKKTVPEKPPEPAPLVPEMPRVKIHPCAVCHLIELPGDELLKCRDCRLHVHRSCYGVAPEKNTKPKWFCDMCHNDHETQVSTTYECVLCPIKYTSQELMEPLKVSHKKKTDREREKERLEREMVLEAGRRWRQEQESHGRPVNPREALKVTAWNNWVHVICAMWTEEIKFGNAELFDGAEGVGFIPPERFEVPCKICKTVGNKPTVNCFQKGCPAHFHIGCAHSSEYYFGFDIFVPKGTRREAKPMMRLEGEQGSEYGHATAVILCPTHVPERVVHSMLEATEEGITALQLYAKLYKQVDASVTAPVRRAGQFVQNHANGLPPNIPPHRQNSTTNGVSTTNHVEKAVQRSNAISPGPLPISGDELHAQPEAVDVDTKRPGKSSGKGLPKKCCTCSVDVSPRWWPVDRPVKPLARVVAMTNGNHIPDEQSVSRHVENSMMDAQPPAGTSALTSQMRPQEPDTEQDRPRPNGIIKVESSPDMRVQDALATHSDEVLYQCHKCHKQNLAPPSSSPHPKNSHVLFGPEAEPEPIFRSSAFNPFPAPTTWSRPREETQAHTHPTTRPPGHPWPAAPPSDPYPQHHPGWPSASRNGVAPSHPPAPAYHRPAPSPLEYYPRPAYPLPYATAPPPPSRPLPNGVPQHHSPPPQYGYPHSHSHGLPPPPPQGMAVSPQSHRYGHPPADQPPRTSPQVQHNAPQPPPQSNPFERAPYHPHSHSRTQSSDSQQQRPYSSGTVPPPQPRNYGPPPPPPSQSSSNPPTETVQRMDRSLLVQSASELPGFRGAGLGDARAQSVDSAGTRRPSTPSERERDMGPRREVAPGASASPRVQNLLI